MYLLVCTNIRKHFITYENLMAFVYEFIVLYNTTFEEKSALHTTC